MPNPMPDPDGGKPTWFFHLDCGHAVTSTDEFGFIAGQQIQCADASHGLVTVQRGETAEEVDARF